MKTKLFNALSLAVIMAMVFTSLALADQVINTIDNTIDSTLEVRTITAGDSTSVGFYIKNQNTSQGGDPVNQCNVAGGSPATITFNIPSGVNASTSSLDFTACDVTQNITFSSNTPNLGGYEISIKSVTGGRSGGAWDTTPAAFKLVVNPATNTSPSVSVTGVADGDSYEFGSVPAAICQVTDAEDGNSSFAATLGAITGSLAAYGLGSQAASCEYTDDGGLSDSDSATYSIVDTTPPTIDAHDDVTTEATGPTGANVSYTSPATDDAVFGNGVASCAPASGSLFPLGDTTVTCNASDGAGNAATPTQFVVYVVDTTPPDVTVTPDRGPDHNGWYNAPVIFDTNGTDIVSGPLNSTCTVNQTYTGPDGTGLTVSGSCTDNAANNGTGTSDPFNFDDTDPSISVALDPSPVGTWFNIATGAPVAKFTCLDATSDIASCPADYTFDQGEDLSHEGTAYDNAGNSASASVGNVYVDLTAPTLTWDPGMIADGGSFYFGFVPAWPPNPCVAVDTLSGPAGCSVTDSHPGGFGAVGTHDLTATAYDLAGNSYSETRTYTVLAWELRGFYQPVDMNGVFNTVKGGSTVPLKFEVFAGTMELKLTSYITGFSAQAVPCPVNGFVADEIEVLATGGTSLRFDMTGDQFIFNWQTPKKPGACYKVTMTALDGSSLSAYFKLK